MNVEKLSDFSVKIGVSGADLKRRSINMHKINMDSPACKKLLQEIVQHAEVELDTPISAARINMEVVEGPDEHLEFIVSDLSSEDLSSQTGPENWGVKDPENRKISRNQPPAGVPQFILSRKNNQSAENEAQPPEGNGSGSIAEAIIRRIMLDGLMSSVLKGHGQPNERGGGMLPPEQDEAAQDEDQRQGVDSISELIDSRRKEVFGEDFEENGGVAVVAFPDYNTLYSFVREYDLGRRVKSSLYEYAGAFYLVLDIPAAASEEFFAIDNCVPEYRGMILPAAAALPVLTEHGKLMFARRADVKIRESMN